jgi:hypothetical protein
MNKLNTGGKETKSKVTNVSNLYGITMLAILCSKVFIITIFGSLMTFNYLF